MVGPDPEPDARLDPLRMGLRVEWIDETEASVWREHYAFADGREEPAWK